MTNLHVNEQGYRIGESHPRCRLSDAVVRTIRDLHELEGVSYRAIADRLAVAYGTVMKVCQYRFRSQTSTLERPVLRHGRWRRGQRPSRPGGPREAEHRRQR